MPAEEAADDDAVFSGVVAGRAVSLRERAGVVEYVAHGAGTEGAGAGGGAGAGAGAESAAALVGGVTCMLGVGALSVVGPLMFGQRTPATR